MIDRRLAIAVMLACLGCNELDAGSGTDADGGGKQDDPDGAETVEIVVDHMGRVEPNNWMLRDDDVKSAFNHEDVFAIARVIAAEREGATADLSPQDEGLLQRLAIYREAMAEGLAELDGRDGDDDEADWPVPHPLVDLMLANYLVVDLGKDCNELRNRDAVETAIEEGELVLAAGEDARNYNIVHSNYFAVELAAFRGSEHATCGGRFIDEDTIDRTLTLFINGPVRNDDPEIVRRDNVDHPNRRPGDVFPYVGR
jgi:hypothetical protein